jgi:ribosome-associated protein
MDRDALRREIRRKTELSYSRSGGPGGQNVNKRDTKATARLRIAELEEPGETGRERLARRLASRLTNEGDLVLQADGERSQARNREDALERMESIIAAALRPEPKKRRPSRPSKAARERRLAAKKRRSAVKSARRKPLGEED